MNDLEIVNKLIANAVETSSYNTVILSSCVFIAYTLIIKVVEYVKARNRNKPILEMTNAIRGISENVVKLNAVLDRTFKDAEQKEVMKLRHVITIGWGNLQAAIANECNNVIIHNNVIANKDNISQNIYKFVSTEYYKLYSILSAYELNNVIISTRLKEEWIDKIATDCLNIIFSMDDTINRIRLVNHKLIILTEEYATIMTNKTFNH
jgi:hypothetical protein|nr:MAG TPA: hypothetical protein [Crassvirales sp.]